MENICIITSTGGDVAAHYWLHREFSGSVRQTYRQTFSKKIRANTGFKQRSWPKDKLFVTKRNIHINKAADRHKKSEKLESRVRKIWFQSRVFDVRNWNPMGILRARSFTAY